ncbi:hypothetical protein Z517_02350 [Fonsecaea pedrosoi CBS 271.37]|uniref:Uncharacterized protein n=1 Tax=Fonsecaea pedrosoi CBS 271.37 TaxID=1442368 RepID=A0A0D2DZ98_9EURO|nr:uncharacterized protein Z517_02350 [Fonsecaea pedrosoi CBS 271.37]KIW83106.1 hypothetical protein Z517_02350 [Fonsecaea pedrosoi CBS 271.37]
MPRTYLRVLLTFKTTKSVARLIQPLQCALNDTAQQIPWLNGRVVTTESAAMKPSLELRWHSEDGSPTLHDLGSIPMSYDSAAADGMIPNALPAGIWPLQDVDNVAFLKDGAQAFSTGIFRFGDGQGVGLTICIHHNVTDAQGFTDLVRLWVSNLTGSGLRFSSDSRLDRLSKVLTSELTVANDQSLEALFARHAEYSQLPPSLPSEFPSCTSKLFAIPAAQAEASKKLLRNYTTKIHTTNTIICALIWSTITRIRNQRQPPASGNTRLAMAVNGRRCLGEDFSSPTNPYIGNIVLYSLAKLSKQDLNITQQESIQNFARICDTIAASNSRDKINCRHIAETYSLITRVKDYQSIFIGWDPLAGHDLTITSWADVGLYDIDFGPELGKPSFIRIPGAQADGVCIILPRKRLNRDDADKDIVEVLLMLRKDDMETLEKDSIWKGITS